MGIAQWVIVVFSAVFFLVMVFALVSFVIRIFRHAKPYERKL